MIVDRRKRAHELDEAGKAAMFREPPDTATAIRAFEESYKLDPNPHVLYSIATANYLAGNCARARSSFQKLLAQTPPGDLAEKAKRGLARVASDQFTACKD